MRRIAMSLVLLVLSACAAAPGTEAPVAGRIESAPAKQVHTDLVREMVSQGRYYAALAHIEELQKTGGPRDELLLLHAQVLARLDRKNQAEQEYKQLLGSAFDGEARHGLGLLYAPRNYSQSLQYLREAARLRPTDPSIRNDYGYALLAGGQYPEARLHLATAYELDSGVDKYRNNYLLALLIFKDNAGVERMRKSGEISDKLLQNLRAQATDWPAVVQRNTAAVRPVSSATSVPAKVEPTTAKSPAARNNSVKKKLGTPGVN